MHSITHGGANCNILRRIFARMRERRGFFVPFCRPARPAAACASPRAQRKPAVPREPPRPSKAVREPPRRQKRRGAFGFFPRRRARMGAAAGSGELGRKGAAAGERERKEGAGRGLGEEKKRKKRSAKLPNASYRGSFVSRRGSWNKRSIRGTSYKRDKYCANILPPSRGRRGLLPKAYSYPCSIRSGFQKSRSSDCRKKRTQNTR